MQVYRHCPPSSCSTKYRVGTDNDIAALSCRILGTGTVSCCVVPRAAEELEASPASHDANAACGGSAEYRCAGELDPRLASSVELQDQIYIGAGLDTLS